MSETITFESILLDYQRLIHYIDEHGGEITPEVESVLSNFENHLDAYSDKYLYVINKLKNDANYYKDLASKFHDQFARYMATADYMESRLKELMLATGRQEVSGRMFRARVSNSAPKVVIKDGYPVPSDFVEIETVTKILKKEIADYMKIRGVTETDFAKLVPVKRLTISISKELK